MTPLYFFFSFLFLCFAFFPVYAQSQPTVTTVTGSPFVFTTETSLTDPLYSWVLSAHGRIVTSQAERFFQHTFEQPGSYDLSLTLRSLQGGEESQSITILVEQAAQISAQGTGLQAVLRTHPPTDGSRRVALPVNGGVLRLFADDSTGNIAFYEFDLNLSDDSDGDGDPTNDVDNSFDPSYRTGEVWQVSVRPAPGEAERQIALRVVDHARQTQTAGITIVFDPTLQLSPRLRTQPRADSTSALTLTDGDIVRFNAADSFGGARRYALDLNLNQDSDGDGIASNDNDVAGSPFARDGSDIWIMLQSTPERRASLIVTDDQGRSAAEELTLRFSDIAEPPVGQSQIVADNEPIVVGKSFLLRIVSPPPGAANYYWDLQSDGIPDTETQEPQLLLEPDAPGVLPIRVTVTDPFDSPIQTISQEFVVAEGSTDDAPVDDLQIAATVKGLTATFEILSDEPLNELRLKPEWSFGDDARSFLYSPTHTYEAPGTYTVSVFLRDVGSDSIDAAARASVTVTALPSDGQTDQRDRSFLGVAISFLFRVLLIILLIALVIVGPIVLFLSLQARKRNVSISEVINQYQQRIVNGSDDVLIASDEISAEKQQEAVEAEVVESTEPQADEIAPMKIVKQEEVPSETVEEPAVTEAQTQEVEPEPPAPADAAPVAADPAPAEPTPAPPAPEPPVAPSPAPPSTGVPEWLQQGMEKSEDTEQMPTPPPAPPAASEPPPAPPPEQSPPEPPAPSPQPVQNQPTVPEWLQPAADQEGTVETPQESAPPPAAPESTQQDNPPAPEQPQTELSDEERERKRRKRQRYRANKRARERAAKEAEQNGTTTDAAPEETIGQPPADEPIAFIKAEGLEGEPAPPPPPPPVDEEKKEDDQTPPQAA